MFAKARILAWPKPYQLPLTSPLRVPMWRKRRVGPPEEKQSHDNFLGMVLSIRCQSLGCTLETWRTRFQHLPLTWSLEGSCMTEMAPIRNVGHSQRKDTSASVLKRDCQTSWHTLRIEYPCAYRRPSSHITRIPCRPKRLQTGLLCFRINKKP